MGTNLLKWFGPILIFWGDGIFYASYINAKQENPLHLIVEQGHEIGKDGRGNVQVTKSEDVVDIKISGNAVYVKAIKVTVKE